MIRESIELHNERFTTSSPEAVDGLSVYDAALDIADKLYIHRKLYEIRQGPPSWVFVDGDSNSREPEYAPDIALRLTNRGDSSQHLDTTIKEVALLKMLRAKGASIQKFIGEPIESDGFIGTVSHYLPEMLQDYGAYGHAVATLHNAGAYPDITMHAKPFRPLRRPRYAYDYLVDLYTNGDTLRMWDVEFPCDLLPLFGEYLAQGDMAVNEMLQLSKERQYPLTIILHDAQPANARQTYDGITTLIDLDGITVGPAEYDLGRPLGQWTPRFKRPAAFGRDFLNGYKQTINRQPDPDILDLALSVSQLRYATSVLVHAVEAYREGRVNGLDTWRLAEGIKRLANLDDPYFKWQSRETYPPI